MLKKSTQKGFSIIEVLIVLAIAGLIMLIVFLAVPALQRNSRNSARSADASRVSAAINDCVANNNGKLASCDSAGEIDPQYITIANNQQLIAVGAPTTDAINIVTAVKCNDTNTATVAASARSYAVTYQIESNSGNITKCLGS